MSPLGSHLEDAPAGPVVLPFDHVGDPEYLADPWGWLREHARPHRVFYSTAHGGFWVLTRYEDVQEVMRRPEVFSARELMVPKPAYSRRWIPGQLDPPEHAAYRKILQPMFTPRRVLETEHLVRSICRDLLGHIAPQGGCDFVRDFAAPLPSILFARLTGVPESDLEWLREVSLQMMVADDPKAQTDADEQLVDYLRQLIGERRSAVKTEDWVGVILSAPHPSPTLSVDEQLNMLQFLFLAGLVTTTSFLTLGWWLLAQRPDLRRRLIDEPDVLPLAVDELLRYTSNITPCREVLHEVDFAGVHMRAGDIVMMGLPTANRDAAQFNAPDVVDFDRHPNSHVSFGVGAHHCLGAGLARLETRIALEEFHARIPDYEIAPGASLRWVGGINLHIPTLPLRWSG